MEKLKTLEALRSIIGEECNEVIIICNIPQMSDCIELYSKISNGNGELKEIRLEFGQAKYYSAFFLLNELNKTIGGAPRRTYESLFKIKSRKSGKKGAPRKYAKATKNPHLIKNFSDGGSIIVLKSDKK